MVVEMKIAGLALDEKSKAPIVVLKNEAGDKTLPIVIGIMEASAIAARLEAMDFPRPMTHDLLASVLEKLGGRLESVEVCDIINDTFYALLHIVVDPPGESGAEPRRISIDARPSDSIALALRTGATILVNELIFEKTHAAPKARSPDDDVWKEILESMEDDDFGKYQM